MKTFNRRDFLTNSSLTVAYLVTTSAFSYSNLVFNATEIIRTGEKITIKPGNVINYTNLPNQPIALIAYNNSGNNTEVIVNYINIRSMHLESVSEFGLSLGEVFLLNPEVTKKNEITISIPRTEPNNSSVDVYCVSLLFPIKRKGINSFEIKDKLKYLKNYSRSICYS